MSRVELICFLHKVALTMIKMMVVGVHLHLFEHPEFDARAVYCLTTFIFDHPYWMLFVLLHIFVLWFAAVPLLDCNTYIVDIEYSPLVGGFAVVLNDGRAAFLTAVSLRFDPNVSFILHFIWYVCCVTIHTLPYVRIHIWVIQLKICL